MLAWRPAGNGNATKSIGQVMVALLLLALPTRGELLLSYEGDVFPEEAGWVRSDPPAHQGPFTRTIEEGVFVIDTPASGLDRDDYSREIQLDGDQALYEWSAGTSNDKGGSYIDFILRGPTAYSEILVTWWADNATVGFSHAGVPGQFVNITLAPAEFHTFRVESDGALHRVYVDDILRVSDTLQSPAGLTVRTKFGFIHVFDEPAKSYWDYIRVGAIPEPSTIGLLMPAIAAWLGRRGRVQ